jgi:hypothetical protein
MFHTNLLHGRGEPVNMSPRKFPESPSDVGQPEIKRNPALFALTLSEHTGFDALAARTMTPPPRYSRIEQPRLTLQIPEEVQQDGEATSMSSVESLNDTIITDSTIASPTTTSPSKHPENKLFLKVKEQVKRRGKGIRSRLRKSTSRTGSASTTPHQGSPASPLAPPEESFAHSTSNDASPHSPASPQLFSAVQELDSRQINTVETSEQGRQPANNGGFLSHLFSSRHAEPHCDIRRSESVSSIIPTPRRGLSIAAPESRRPPVTNFSPMDLTGRLESLSEQGPHDHDAIVSPWSPVSPTSPSVFDASPLMRSNAITDRIFGMGDPVSPISALPGASPPPSSPTLDGRLNFLPRLSVPQALSARTNDRGLNSSNHASRRTNLGPRQFAELDYGKELVNIETSEAEVVGGWYTSPSTNGCISPVPRITVDHAANAPEVVNSQELSALDTRQLNNPSLPSRLYTGRPFQPSSPLAALTGTLWESLLSGIIKSTELLRQCYGPDPPVPENHVRVRWKCVSTLNMSRLAIMLIITRLVENTCTMITLKTGLELQQN